MTLSLSTCWNSWKHHDGRAIAEEILGLGFDTLEISHGIRSSQLEGILAAKSKRKFNVSSVHNFLPMPIEVTSDSPDCYEFTSPRPSERERAVKLTLTTIDWAAKLEAPFVVIHTGRIRSLDLTRILRKTLESQGMFSDAYIKAKFDALKAREKASEVHDALILDCLTQVVGHAGKAGVKLGLENREHYESAPLDRQFDLFLKRLASPHAGYWHDFGHAQIKHNLGLLDHAQLLKRMSPNLLGCHIHDTRWPFRDHCPPFTGDTPFDQLVPLLPKSCATIFEIAPRTDAGDIRKAADQWIRRYG